MVRNLGDYDAEVNAPNYDTGRTPLHCSLKDYYDDKFLALIKCGADCSAQDKNGDNPLYRALQVFSYFKLKIETLLKNSADSDIKNSKDKTPLHGIRERNSLHEILPLLIEAGANLKAKTPSGKTVLMQFISGWQSRSSLDFLPQLLALLEAGARINSRDHDDNTVLHLLCQHAQSAKLVRALVKTGADPLTIGFAGNTLLHYVQRQRSDYQSEEQVELLELMLELGIDPSARNNLGQTPFHISVEMRYQYWCYTNGALEFLLGRKCNPI